MSINGTWWEATVTCGTCGRTTPANGPVSVAVCPGGSFSWTCNGLAETTRSCGCAATFPGCPAGTADTVWLLGTEDTGVCPNMPTSATPDGICDEVVATSWSGILAAPVTLLGLATGVLTDFTMLVFVRGLLPATPELAGERNIQASPTFSRWHSSLNLCSDSSGRHDDHPWS